jgi:hypothetical protein
MHDFYKINELYPASLSFLFEGLFKAGTTRLNIISGTLGKFDSQSAIKNLDEPNIYLLYLSKKVSNLFELSHITSFKPDDSELEWKVKGLAVLESYYMHKKGQMLGPQKEARILSK